MFIVTDVYRASTSRTREDPGVVPTKKVGGYSNLHVILTQDSFLTLVFIIRGVGPDQVLWEGVYEETRGRGKRTTFSNDSDFSSGIGVLNFLGPRGLLMYLRTGVLSLW